MRLNASLKGGPSSLKNLYNNSYYIVAKKVPFRNTANGWTDADVHPLRFEKLVSRRRL